MYRDRKQVLTHRDHRFILQHGALGDIITSLPAIVHARISTSDEMKMTAYVPPWQVELIDHLLKPYGKIDVRPITEVPLSHKERLEAWTGEASTSLNAPAHNTHTRNREHMVDFAFHYLIDSDPQNMNERSYPVLAPLGARMIEGEYVVFPVGATSDNKLFKAAVMAPIIQWVIGRGYKPVLVGTKVSRTHAETGDGQTEQLVIRDEVDKFPEGLLEKCVDLREKTTLLECRDACGHAAAVVGVDGGILHLAGTTDVNIIFAAGTTLPKHRYIARFGDPHHRIKYVGPRNLECAGCQSRWIMTRWDFRFCPYSDNACMSLLHYQDFIDGLKELGL